MHIVLGLINLIENAWDQLKVFNVAVYGLQWDVYLSVDPQQQHGVVQKKSPGKLNEENSLQRDNLGFSIRC